MTRQFVSPQHTGTFDIALVGCGLHALTLLAEAPQLLDFSVALIEKGSRLGGGAMRGYLGSTNSNASKFLAPFSTSPLFAELFRSNRQLSELLHTHRPIGCRLVGEALDAIGASLFEKHNPYMFLNRVATSIDYASPPPVRDPGFTGGGGFTVHLSDGSRVGAHVCILATGRNERLSSALSDWREKVILSSAVLEGRVALSTLVDSRAPKHIAIIGSSHAAFTIVNLLLDEIDRLEIIRHELMIDILYRDEIALYYPSVEQARDEQMPGREKLLVNSRDVCPETGAVFRDSGLRGRAKETYRQITSGGLPQIRLVRISDIRNERLQLSGYDHVIQAIGFQANVPPCSWWPDRSVDEACELMTVGENALVTYPTCAAVREIPPLFALRVVPTKRTDKDHNPAAHNVYRRLASAAEALLQHHCAVSTPST